MILKHCAGVVPFTDAGRRGSAVAARKEEYVPQNFQTEYVPATQRPLAVILSWLAAQDRHMEKYRAMWLQRGFDVLTVKTTPYQFLLPKYGTHILTQDLIKFLYAHSQHYPELVLHCFSVGAYSFGELLNHLNDKEFMRTIESRSTGSDPKQTLEKAIKGIIFDSAVNFEGIAKGVSRSITNQEVPRKAIEASINGHLKLSYYIATKHYERASAYAHGNYLNKAPALVMVSNKDHIGERYMNEKLVKCWQDKGIDVSFKVFESSGHVQHLTKYPEEYADEIDSFLKKVQLDTLN